MFIPSSQPTAAWTSRLLLGVVGVLAVYFGIYATVSGANVAYLAWFFHVPMIEKYFAGTWVFADAIQRYGEHGLLGYNLLLLANVKFFHLNVFFDIYLNALIVTGVGLVVCWGYHRAETREDGRWAVPLLFLPVAFALFSVTQQSSGAMETQVRLGTIFYFWAAFWIDRNLLSAATPPKLGAMVSGVILIALAVLVFGTLYSFAGFPALVLLCIYAALIRPQVRTYAIVMGVTLVAAVLAYIRFYELHLEAPAGTALGLAERAVLAVRFMAAYLGSATLGRTLWEDRVVSSEALMWGNGLFVAGAYVFSLWIFWRTRMQRVTWLPVLLIAYTVGVGALVLIGRGAMFGWTGGTNYWYAVHVKFALAGCLWIYAHALLQQAKERRLAQSSRSIGRAEARACAAIMIVFVACVALSNYLDWRRAPHVRRYFEAMVPYGLGSLEGIPVDAAGNTPFKASRSETIQSLRFFRVHGLTFYAAYQLPTGGEHDIILDGAPTVHASMGTGWHEHDGTARWMSGRAQVFFRSGAEGVLVVEGYLPGIVAPNTISLSIDGKVVHTQLLTEGVFHLEARLPPNKLSPLTLTVAKHIVPRDEGLNADMRDLGLMITRISTR